MGVKDLWRELKPVGKPVPVRALGATRSNPSGSRLAIDFLVWYLQSESRRSFRDQAATIRITYYRLCRLLELGVRPIFIVDGTEKPQQKKSFRGKWKGTSPALQACLDLIQLFGFPVIYARGEAEATCAWLTREGLADAVVSPDADSFLFGATCVIPDWDPARGVVRCFEARDIESQLGLSRESLILFALMTGSDYTKGIHGFGGRSASKVIPSNKLTCFSSRTEIVEAVDSVRKGMDVPVDFPSSDVVKLYLNPVVGPAVKKRRQKGAPRLETDEHSDRPASLHLEWRPPDVPKLFSYCRRMLWSVPSKCAEKLETSLVPGLQLHALARCRSLEKKDQNSQGWLPSGLFVEKIHGVRNSLSSDSGDALCMTFLLKSANHSQNPILPFSDSTCQGLLRGEFRVEWGNPCIYDWLYSEKALNKRDAYRSRCAAHGQGDSVVDDSDSDCDIEGAPPWERDSDDAPPRGAPGIAKDCVVGAMEDSSQRTTELFDCFRDSYDDFLFDRDMCNNFDDSGDREWQTGTELQFPCSQLKDSTFDGNVENGLVLTQGSQPQSQEAKRPTNRHAWVEGWLIFPHCSSRMKEFARTMLLSTTQKRKKADKDGPFCGMCSECLRICGQSSLSTAMGVSISPSKSPRPGKKSRPRKNNISAALKDNRSILCYTQSAGPNPDSSNPTDSAEKQGAQTRVRRSKLRDTRSCSDPVDVCTTVPSRSRKGVAAKKKKNEQPLWLSPATPIQRKKLRCFASEGRSLVDGHLCNFSEQLRSSCSHCQDADSAQSPPADNSFDSSTNCHKGKSHISTSYNVRAYYPVQKTSFSSRDVHKFDRGHQISIPNRTGGDVDGVGVLDRDRPLATNDNLLERTNLCFSSPSQSEDDQPSLTFGSHMSENSIMKQDGGSNSHFLVDIQEATEIDNPTKPEKSLSQPCIPGLQAAQDALSRWFSPTRSHSPHKPSGSYLFDSLSESSEFRRSQATSPCMSPRLAPCSRNVCPEIVATSVNGDDFEDFIDLTQE
eukprot:Rmarinus@m.2936